MPRLKTGRSCLISELYYDVIMIAIASQITSLTIVYSTVYSGTDQRTHQNSASLAFVRGIHRWPLNFQHKWPVTRKMFPFDDVIMTWNPMFRWQETKFLKLSTYPDGVVCVVVLFTDCRLIAPYGLRESNFIWLVPKWSGFNFKWVTFIHILVADMLNIFCQNWPRVYATEPHWW